MMIDLKKNRSSFQKFPLLKQKCEPVVVKPQSTIKSLQYNTAAKATSLKQAKQTELNATTAAIDNNKLESVSNPVRDANQHFFLIPDYQDHNFLKEECKLAHAQVSKSRKDLKTITAALPPVLNSRRVSTSIKNNNLPRTSTAADSAATVNVMRRTGNATHSGTTTAVASGINKVEISYSGPQFKGLAAATAPSSVTTKKLGSASSAYGQTKLTIRNQQIKPLVHRSTQSQHLNTSTSNTTSSSSSPSPAVNQNSCNNNNNGSNSSLNSISGGNNNMQASIDQEDIKFIDSDEQPAIGTVAHERKSLAHCDQRYCSNSHSHSVHNNSIIAKARVRPKSTIICTSSASGNSVGNNLLFEKINHYKYSNGSVGGVPATTKTVSISSVPAITNEKRSETAIDSNSIRASIEKFNSFSEQKRLPLSSVTLRSSSGSGSTSNLQHHRHSTDLDNCNLRLTSSGGGSLTRTPYRSSGGSKVITSLHPNASAAVSSVSVRHALNTNPNSTGSLPLKTSKHYAHAEDSSISGLSGSVDGDVGKKKLISISGALCDRTTTNTPTAKTMDESVRSSAPLRSVLPPASPTASRYWDRDNSRSSLLSSSSLHNNSDDTKKSTATDEETEGLCGLRNIGNTCFMNSVIQCLSHTNELTKFLRNYSATKSTLPSSSSSASSSSSSGYSTTSKDLQILYEFSKLIKEMWQHNVNSVTPMELKRSFSAKHRMYSDYNQQDAQEFLRFFLDSLHSALNTGVKGGHLKIDDNLSDNKKAELTWEWYGRHENSLIRDLFVGQLKSTLKCTTCGNTSVTFDPFWDLSVPLPSSSRCKLDACLDLFIREEVLDGDEMPTCSKCQTRRKCTKSFTIQRFPKYLVIHLKRFSETRWSKMTNIVEFPTGERELNMGPYGANANSNIYYSLYGISNHMGSTAGGHYVALCKHPISKKWHEFNDNIVSDSLSDHHLVSSSAYILFYERA